MKPARINASDMPYGILGRLRSGRYAYCSGSRSASKMGPKTQHRSHLHYVRSRIQGIPSGRVLPGWPSLGMFTLRRGWGDTFAGVVLPSIRPATSSLSLDPLERHTVHARHSWLARAAVERVLKDVLAVDLVVEGVESVVGRSLRFGVTPI